MKEQLEQLSNTAMNLISTLARKGDAPAISRVAATASRIQQLQEQLQNIEQEIPQIEEKLKAFTLGQVTSDPRRESPKTFAPTDGHSGRKRLQITVDWGRLGKPGGKEVICEHMSSDTMTKWAARLYQQFGPEPLQKLARFRISRGPMVSNQPQSDYKNHADGSVYSHQPIADSHYYMLTHSQTSQKLNDITRACQKALAFPIGAVIVEDTDKNGW